MTRTVLPPSENTPAGAARRPRAGQDPQDEPAAPAHLIGPDGERRPVPPEICSLVQEMLTALADGRAVTVTVHGAELTTQQAADLLGVSRPTMVRLLDDGVIPSTRPNKHRRVRLADVEAYRTRRRDLRSEGPDAVVRMSEELDPYDEGPEPIRR